MNCPYCDSMMEKGFISGQAPIYFTTNITELLVVGRIFPRKGDIPLKGYLEKVRKGDICKTCKKIIFDYSILEFYENFWRDQSIYFR